MSEKIAYHLKKGDVIKLSKRERAKVELVVPKDMDRNIHVTVRVDGEDGKRVLFYKWNETIELALPPSKRRHKAFIKWIANKLNVVVKFGV